MEKSLRSLIETNIPELKNETYPTNAPESHTKPYLVYTRITTRNIKTLEGYEDEGSLSFMFSIMAIRYGDMVRIRKEIEILLKLLPKQTIGSDIFIDDIEINNIHERFEHELKVNRGIIDFTIYF